MKQLTKVDISLLALRPAHKGSRAQHSWWIWQALWQQRLRHTYTVPCILQSCLSSGLPVLVFWSLKPTHRMCMSLTPRRQGDVLQVVIGQLDQSHAALPAYSNCSCQTMHRPKAVAECPHCVLHQRGLSVTAWLSPYSPYRLVSLCRTKLYSSLSPYAKRASGNSRITSCNDKQAASRQQSLSWAAIYVIVQGES